MSTPRLRAWTIGLLPQTTLRRDGATALLLTGRRALLEVTGDDAPVALVARLGLGPRPAPDLPAVRLAPAAMAILIGRRQAHDHGLPADLAAALQRRLDAGVRHWAVRVERGGGRHDLEVVEGGGGIWRVRPLGPDLVELAPTTTTAVVRELVDLLGGPRAGIVPCPASD